MRTRTVLLLVFTVAALIALSGALLGARIASQVETASISIHDKNEGTRLVLPVPVGLISAITSSHVHFHCDDEDMRDFEKVRAVLKEASVSLQNVPDMTLLEVEDGRDHVTLRKEGENLRLHVNSPDAEVLITIPSRAL
jgi:hypothetical protein